MTTLVILSDDYIPRWDSVVSRRDLGRGGVVGQAACNGTDAQMGLREEYARSAAVILRGDHIIRWNSTASRRNLGGEWVVGQVARYEGEDE